MPTWYKRDAAAALEGMRILTLEERGAYNTILDLIYDREGNVPDDDRFIAGWLGCPLQRWKKLKASLVVFKKLTIVNGKISNPRAEKEIESRKEFLNDSKTFGEFGAKKRKENNVSKSGYPSPTYTYIDKELENLPHARRSNFSDIEKTAPILSVVRSYSEMDFISTDGSVYFAAAELESMKADYPSIKDVRAMVRQGVRWADAEAIEPSRRKAAVLAWLAKKNLAAESVRAREVREVEREANRDHQKTGSVARHRGQAVLP